MRISKQKTKAMASTTNPITPLAKIAILSLCLISASSVSTQTPEQYFSDCFRHLAYSPLATSDLLHAPDTPSYNKYFKANIQNLWSPDTTVKKPSFVVTPVVESDIQGSVVCAGNASFGVRVRSGGHDYEGLSYLTSSSSESNPYILIDLAHLFANNNITIDPNETSAWVSGGATLGQLYYKIAKKSNIVAFPASICPTLGVGGHFSGGGIGTLMRKYGVSADNIQDVQIVSPDGRLLEKSSMSKDHFWAIRGGGGPSFGIITRYKIKLVSVPGKVTTFTIRRTLEQGATRLLEQWQHAAPKLDHNVFIRVLARAVNDGEAKGNRTIRVTFQCLFLGRASKLVPLMDEQFPKLGVKAEDCEEMSWIQSVLDFAGYGKNTSLTVLKSRRPLYRGSFKAKSDFVKEPISQNEWEKIWKFMLDGKEEPMMMIMDPWGGKMDEIDENKIAFPHRKGNLYNIQYYMMWTDKDEKVKKRHLSWMKKFYGFMSPCVSKNPRASYLNYKDLDLGWNKGGRTNYSQASGWGKKYFLNNFEKLACVKGEVDPDNKFWNELSIPPLLKN